MGYLYHVEDLLREMESGRLRPVIALKDGHILGHMALVEKHTPARFCEAGITVVHRSARGQGLMMKLATRLHELAQEAGYSGYLQYPTTAHHIMQKASVAYGGIETGLMLSYVGAESDFQGRPSLTGRLAATVAYQPVSAAPPRRLARLPGRYQTLLRQLYRSLGLPLEVENRPDFSPRHDARLALTFNKRWRYLQMEVEEVGERLGAEVELLIDQYQPCVSYIDLPVDCNGVDLAVESLNAIGFFYSALLPCLYGADILRLQRLQGARESDFQPDLANETAGRLLDYARREAQSIGVLPPGRGEQRRMI